MAYLHYSIAQDYKNNEDNSDKIKHEINLYLLKFGVGISKERSGTTPGS